jgi:hypothetical protein
MDLFDDGDTLFEAMECFCSGYDKTEGYRQAIVLTLEDQIYNHPDKPSLESDMRDLLDILDKQPTTKNKHQTAIRHLESALASEDTGTYARELIGEALALLASK